MHQVLIHKPKCGIVMEMKYHQVIVMVMQPMMIVVTVVDIKRSLRYQHCQQALIMFQLPQDGGITVEEAQLVYRHLQRCPLQQLDV